MPDEYPAHPPLNRLDGPVPPARILSDGRYAVLITGAGTGFSTCDGLMLHAWPEDRIEDAAGFVVYVRDVQGAGFRSIGARPAGEGAASPAPGGAAGARRYDAEWTPGLFRIAREDEGLAIVLEVFVPPGERAEIRRVRVSDLSGRSRRVEITTCIEPVVNDRLAHAAHPAFSKLFLQTEIVTERRAIVVTRRPRANVETPPWAVHALAGAGTAEHETDRERFVGRARPTGRPRALAAGEPLSAAAGCMIEPVLALRAALEIPARGSAERAFLLALAPTREDALATADRFAAPEAVSAARERAKEHARTVDRSFGLDEAGAAYAQALAGAVLYGHPALRAPVETLARVRVPREMLGSLGLSSHRAYVVVDGAPAAAVERMARIGRYWRALGLSIDLAFIGEGGAPAAWTADGPSGAETPAPRPIPGAGRFLALRRGGLAPETLDLVHAGARLLVRGPLPDLGADPPHAPEGGAR